MNNRKLWMLAVLAEGGDICQYQWAMVLPNKTEKVLEGENQPTLTLPSVQLYQSGYAFYCLITAPDGRTLRTNKAYLTVVPNQKTVPQTGDAMQPYALTASAAASLALCAAAMLLRCKVRRAKN